MIPRARIAPRVAALALATVSSIPAAALAHRFAPLLIELTEQEDSDGATRVDIQLTAAFGQQDGLGLRIARRCRSTAAPVTRRTPTAVRRRWSVRCTGGLRGGWLAVDALKRGEAIVQLVLADGTRLQRVLRPGSPRWRIPARQGAWTVLRGYVQLGIGHILAGYDHLLFVLCMLLVVSDRRRLIAAITAFTLGHSVTLSLAVCGVLQVRQGPVEALIALSIALLAAEAARARRAGVHSGAPRGLSGRRPWLWAALFGLLHGLGFAGALAELGLPPGALAPALAGFNLGVELGQLGFIAASLAAAGLARRARLPLAARRAVARTLVPYLAGCTGACWFFQRTVALLQLGN